MDGRTLRRTLGTHEMIARAYKDDRFPSRGPDTRMLAVTMLWVLGIERPPRGGRVQRACDILHLSPHQFWGLIKQDVPRWEPDGWPDLGFPPCEAPMIRRDGPCGQPQSVSFRVTDPATGEWRDAPFCSRHRPQGEALYRQNAASVRAGAFPVPLPNTGGLLPCYISWNWPDLYARAVHPRKWEPPATGICADDWPVLAKVSAMEPPKLRLLGGDGEMTGTSDAPSLRLVRTDGGE